MDELSKGRPITDSTIEQEMVVLYHNIMTLLPDPHGKVLQFIGARQGEGTSTIVREFAKVAAFKLTKSVLIIDTDQLNASQHLHFNMSRKRGWQDTLINGEDLENAMHRIGDSNLYVSPVGTCPDQTLQDRFSPVPLIIKEKLKQKFDLVLVDSPPVAVSCDGLALAPKMDGVVLVVEAEKTRWPVAKHARDKIERSGGTLLGIVLNKRRYCIPDLIYRRL
ncbi:MAG: CpsD/CapB family tyrosine-protein kinase [Geobacter sp.]|nr:CpsD/CapB family tyrosine-protein kinase [Geobacter sp.]